MKPVPAWISDIERLALGKPVLLVEGDRDALLFEHFLGQHEPGWDLGLYVDAAGFKRRVISGVAVHRPDWIGVVDRDEWSEDDIRREVDPCDRLRVLPRFCIESYFCHPEEIWTALPPMQQAHVGDDLQVLAQPILAELPDWVAHGAMWRVLRRLYQDTRLPTALEQAPIIDEAEIRHILEDWHDKFAPDLVLDRYRQELVQAQRLSTDNQLACYVHGKKFYNQVVVQILDQLFSGKGVDDWLQKFRDAPIQPPDDLKDLLDWVLGRCNALLKRVQHTSGDVVGNAG